MCAQGNPISWARVFDFLASKDIRNIYGRPGITQTQLLEDLALLQGYFPDKYLTGTLGPPEVRAGISDLIVQRVETTGFFCWQLHALAQLIRYVQPIPGSQRLLGQLHSDLPFMNQLHATCYWSRSLAVEGIERVIDGHDIDILSALGSLTLKVHLKTIDQTTKMWRQFIASADIGYVLFSEWRENQTPQRLVITNFDGVIRTDISRDEWVQILVRVPRAPGDYEIHLNAKDAIMVSFALVDAGAPVHGELRGINAFRQLHGYAEEVVDKMPAGDPALNILLGVTSLPRAKDIRLADGSERLDDGAIPILLFLNPAIDAERIGYHYTRSEIFCRRDCIAQRDALDAALPLEMDFSVA